MSKKAKKAAARAIGQRYVAVIFYPLPLRDAVEGELGQATTGPGPGNSSSERPVIEGGKLFPRYLRESITALRVFQMQSTCML